MTAFPGFIDLQSGVDKTEAVAQWLEEGAWQLIFRPIGFGKTAWLDLLQAYCDEAAAPYSEERFSGTWIAAHPTVHKNARRVLRLSFQGCSGADGKTVFLERLRAGMRDFFARYPAEASEAALVREEKSPAGLWDVFSRLVQPMGERRLVVLIDDVDGTGDDAAVLSARQREGEKPWLTAFYGAMKNAQSLLGMRFFAVGENPLALLEWCRGAGLSRNVTTDARYAALFGKAVRDSESEKTGDRFCFCRCSSTVVRRAATPAEAAAAAFQKQRLNQILVLYPMTVSETLLTALKSGSAPAGEPAKAAWHAPEEEMLLSSHLFYAGFLTYSGAGNRALQWTETALRVLDAD